MKNEKKDIKHIVEKNDMANLWIFGSFFFKLSTYFM